MYNFVRMLAAMLCVLLLVPMFSAAYPGYTVENDPVQMPNESPVIDGVIEDNGNWSEPAVLDDASLGHFWATNPLTFTANVYFAYDDNGLYFAADITDNDTASGFVPSTGYDNVDSDYGFNGDILTLMLDPLGVFEKSSNQKTPWYHVGIFSDNTVKVFRTNVNNADITDEVDSAGTITANGWRFEVSIPWSVIAADAKGISSSVAVTETKLATVGSVSRAACMYMDRYYTNGTSVDTWGRYISVCETTYDGINGASTSATIAKAYGITLNHADLHKHVWGEWTTVTSPSCTEPGSKTATCTDPDCQKPTTEVIPATGHLDTRTDFTEPSCTDDGSSVVVCNTCGEKLSTTILPATGHDFGEWVTEEATTDEKHGIMRSYCADCNVFEEKLIPASNAPVAIVENFTVKFENADEFNHIRFVSGVHTSSASVRLADSRIDINSSRITSNTLNGIYSITMTTGGTYTFWVRLNDGRTYLVPVEIGDMKQELSHDGPVLTIHNLYGVKDIYIAEGDHDTAVSIKNGRVKHISSDMIGKKHDYSYSVANAGMHSVLVCYDDENKADSILKLDVAINEPEFEVNGLQIKVGNLEGIKVIRAAYGSYTTSREVKNAAGCRNFTAATIKDSDPYSVIFRESGTVTLAVQYTNGYIKIEEFELERNVPAFKSNGLSVTFGNLDGLYVLRYAPGSYTTSAEIKRADGMEFFKAKDIVDAEIVIDGLIEGTTYTFCVQYNDQTYNYYTVTASSRLVQDEDIVSVDDERQLMLENYVIDTEESDASFVLHSPEKKELAFNFNAAWETRDTVYHNITKLPDGTYRMYYKATQDSNGKRRICYLESTDGLTWTRPSLTTNLYNGSASNIVTNDSLSPDNLFVFYDTNPNCPATQRWKGIYGQWGDGLFLEYSTDGKDFPFWPNEAKMMGTPTQTQGCFFDTLNTVYWDNNLGKYVAFVRGFHEGNNYNLTKEYVQANGSKITRDIRVAYSTDCLNWTIPVPLNYGDNDTYQMYANAIAPYFRAEQLYIGTPTRYQWPTGSNLPVTDIFLMSSRDLVNWDRTEDAYLTPDDGSATWEYGDSGYPSVGFIQTSDSEMSIFMKELSSSGSNTVLYRYALRLDGFRSAHGDINGNTLVTKYMDITGDKLEVNFKTGLGGKIRVTMTDEYGNSTSSDWLSGDEIAKVLDFDGALANLGGQAVKLTFELYNADLYSFKFN